MAITPTGTGTLFTDDLGQPLVGGQVYSYHAGTSELKDTYQDQLFTIPNSNPIILNDTGTADMYLKGAYRLRVLDSDGALVDEVDNAEQEAAKFEAVLKNTQDIEALQDDVENINTKNVMRVDTYNRIIGQGTPLSATTYDPSFRADKLRVGVPSSIELGELMFTTYDTAQTVNGATIAAGSYFNAALIAKESITGDKIAKSTELNTPKLTATLAQTTLDAPNLVLAEDGTLKIANDPLNASTRKVGTEAGNLVERGTNGYPTNNNALGVGQTWQDVTASRSFNTTYTNTTGRTIFVAVGSALGGGYTTLVMNVLVNDVNIINSASMAGSNGGETLSFVVPSGATYSVSGGSLRFWSELR